jgi:hypothetical protein
MILCVHQLGHNGRKLAMVVRNFVTLLGNFTIAVDNFTILVSR